MALHTQNYMAIRNAIKRKQHIIAEYNGHVREMCPHVIGMTNGKEQALFYQFGGTSGSTPILSNSPDNWRCIEISKLNNLFVRDGKWHTSNNHSRAQHCVHDIDVEVDY